MGSCLVEVWDDVHLNMLVASHEIRNHLFTEISIGSHQANCDWNINFDLLGCVDNSLGNYIAFHDTSEDVHEDPFDTRVS